MMQLIEQQKKWIEELRQAAPQPSDSSDPVSYTHLDVYKRQDISIVSRNGLNHLLEGEKILGVETHSLSKIDSWKRVRRP